MSDHEQPHEHKDPAHEFIEKESSVWGLLNGFHLGGEAVTEGTKTLSEIAHHASHAKKAGPLAKMGGFLGPLTMLNGMFEMGHGVNRIRHGEKEEGTLDVLGGGLEVGEGACGIAGLMGSGLAAVLGPALASGAAGVGIGRFGDKEVQRMGVLGKGEDGKNRSISDWAADGGTDSYAETKHASYQTLKKYLPQRMADIGSELAGHSAGIGQTALRSVAGTSLAMGGAAIGGAKRAWGGLKSWFGHGDAAKPEHE